jgi:hypothetical protein
MLTCLVFSNALKSQEIISSLVSFGTNAQGSISGVLGEPVSETGAFGNYYLTQGFCQPNDALGGFTQGVHSVVSLFPNPFHDYVFLSFENEVDDVLLSLYTLNGQRVRTIFLSNCQLCEYNIPDVSVGTYIVTIQVSSSKEEFLGYLIRSDQ